MKTNIVGEKEDLSMIIVSAVRYALGRKTYIVQWTCEFVENNLNLLTEKDIQVMMRDIKLQDDHYGLGDDCDIKCWYGLLNKLEDYSNGKI